MKLKGLPITSILEHCLSWIVSLEVVAAKKARCHISFRLGYLVWDLWCMDVGLLLLRH